MTRRIAAAVFVVALGGCALAACSDNTTGSGAGRYQPSGVAGSSLPVASSSSTVPASSAPASASKTTSAGTHPVPAQPLRTKTVVAGSGRTYVIKIWAEQKDLSDCAAHAYGKAVIKYLRAHPCYGMSRVLATTTVNGRPVGFAQRSIGFKGGMQTSYRAAGGFEKLVSRNGTGNLDDMLRDGYRLPSGPTSVPFPNAFSALGQDNSVTIVEAWYLKGRTPDNDPALVKMAEDIFLQY